LTSFVYPPRQNKNTTGIMMLKVFVSTLAAAGTVAAASCSSSDTLQIQNQGDASSNLGSCTTYTGNIEIQSNFANALDLGSLRSIQGDITAKNAPNITGITGGSLQSISGTFTLNNCQNLAQLQMPKLTEIGDIEFTGLPFLNTLSWGSSVTQVTTLNIQNTFLQSLDGINLQSGVKSITIANNKLLQAVNFQVSSIAGNVIVTNNGDRLQANFPNLETVQNLTFRNCPSISIPSLMNVTGSLGFYENSFQNVSAANLTSVGGTLAINGNTQLNNISLPILKTIGGGFQVQNNTVLGEVTVPNLQTVGGAVDFYGAFTDVELPALKDVRGGFNLQSTKDVSKNCATYKAESGANSVIKGVFKCTQSQTVGNINTNPTNSTGAKKGAASTNSPVPALVAALGGVVALMLTL
jgi:lipopolysaccharide export system protein LptA